MASSLSMSRPGSVNSPPRSQTGSVRSMSTVDFKKNVVQYKETPLSGDYGMIRFKDKPEYKIRHAQLVNANEMMKVFLEKKGFFMDVDYVQTCIKQEQRRNKDGPIVVHFFAKFDPDQPYKVVEYDYDSFGTDADLIQQSKVSLYCLK